MKTHCALDTNCQDLLKMAMEEFQLSASAYDCILRVGRTIADLAAANAIGPAHLQEAIGYRNLDRALWMQER